MVITLFFIGTIIRLRRFKRNISRFLRVSCAAGTKLRVHEKYLVSLFWLPTLQSGAPAVLTPPIRSVPRFRGLLFLVRSCSCPTSQVQTSRWGLFFVSFCVFDFRPISTTAAPQRRRVGLVMGNADGHSGEHHYYCSCRTRR